MNVQKQEQTTEDKHAIANSTHERYEALGADYNIIEQLVKARHQAKLTQADIAASMRTTASAIARLESGGGKKRHSPSLRTLRMYADALNCDIKMQLVAKTPVNTSEEN
jgi:transcriptional regulator with XRE-family HTH domain